ncbi:hypothetical protein TRV_02456 [Trichophyton verrucosum HKI 0517]|uniref:Aprataxin C2HE/C2H2/C2HC zinc finger domain-containing protein n=1 Tax=Trichophyton verrucosum (strain HKI 0517) TaxID=663202 RepID=D4D5T3_TRIVH|nr:uncharacterized protein TRV_02456 [Trichophyton verrucosum HKI 0517]EFE42736.1 hypothetical protein TRV_02456 [Trichophyton verrucosum HKI 0517]
MNPRPKRAASPPIEPKPSRLKPFKNRDGLGAYIKDPESFSASTVVSHSPEFVVIHDLYPKSAVHLLILPRDPQKFFQHPFVAFEDTSFLESVRQEAARVRKQAASELRRKFGKVSALDRKRNEALDADDDGDENTVPDELPEGRDWEKEIIFSTPFFVELDAFPLAEDDKRRHPDREGYLKSDLKCWRCGRNFDNKFTQLKAHLEEEFEEWKLTPKLHTKKEEDFVKKVSDAGSLTKNEKNRWTGRPYLEAQGRKRSEYKGIRSVRRLQGNKNKMK